MKREGLAPNHRVGVKASFTSRKAAIMSKESDKLFELIKRSIEDGVLTNEEYMSILNQAAADGLEDTEELVLLGKLQELIASGTVKKVA